MSPNSDFWQARYTLENHGGSFHTGQTANLLAAITPVFANWTQNPGTLADITNDSDLDTVLTTNGIGAAGSNKITWDLATARRRVVYLKDISLKSAEIDISLDNVTWYTLVDLAHPATMIYGVGMGYFRYMRYAMSGVNTITFLRVLVYNLN
jgi:hypothetical protein